MPRKRRTRRVEHGITTKLNMTRQESPAIADKPALYFRKGRAVYLRTVKLVYKIRSSAL